MELRVLLNTHEQRIVHEVVLLKKLDVTGHHRKNATTVLVLEADPDLLLVVREQVLVLDCRRRRNLFAFNDTVNH